MLTKSILTATAIALVAGLGSAFAGDESTALDGTFAEPVSAFATLYGMTTEPLNRAEMDAVRGSTDFLVKVDGVTRLDRTTAGGQFSFICVIVTTGAGGGVSFSCP